MDVIRSESAIFLCLWCAGLLLGNVFFCFFLLGLPVLSSISGAFFLVLINAYTGFTVKLFWPKKNRFIQKSSGSQACWNWIWTSSIIFSVLPQLYLSEVFPDFGGIAPFVMVAAAHKILAALAVGWDVEDVPRDERDEKIAKEATLIGYAALGALGLISPILLRLGVDVSQSFQRTQGWFFAYFITCILISNFVAQAFIVMQYAKEAYFSRGAQ
jgi:hypothetical protein